MDIYICIYMQNILVGFSISTNFIMTAIKDPKESGSCLMVNGMQNGISKT